MNDDKCCNNRQNFGHPNCGLGVFNSIVKLIFVPLKDSNGQPYAYDLSLINSDTIEFDFVQQNPADRLYSFPKLENFLWEQADTLTEETSSGNTYVLREGAVTISGQPFEKDATPTMKAKIQNMRCADWGVFFVTNTNQLIGAQRFVANFLTNFEADQLIPVPISSTSVDGTFMPTLDASKQKIMFSFKLDRDFDTSTLYMIEGDKMHNAAGNPQPFNFLDTTTVIDSKLDIINTPTTTGFEVAISDEYRQGFRPTGPNGNVTGLTTTDFIVTNKTTGIVVPLSTVVESPTGVYTTTHAALASSDEVEVDLALKLSEPTYAGSITYKIP
jgi:hypothetical protein